MLQSHPLLAWVVLLVGFGVLAKSADSFVESSISLANRFRIPKLVIGLVLVSLATTMPEFAVSLMSALRGHPAIALGNAVGSIICNTGLGLAACALFSAAPVRVIPHVIKTSGGFLAAVALLAFGFIAFDMSLSRLEGGVLVLLFAGYLWFLFRQHRTRRYDDDIDLEAAAGRLHVSRPRLALFFALGLAGILVSSKLLILSATAIARSFHIPEAAIALTLVAFGTSIPEIATCVAAARKKQGALAVGNILGANIMNICWVAGVSSLAHPLTLPAHELLFMFPAMLVILGAALLMLRADYRLTRPQGAALLALYGAFVASFFFVFRAS